MAVDPNQVDGDRLIEFIKSIKNLGDMLEKMNVLEIKDAFLVGRRMGAVDNIIETQKRWMETVVTIREELKIHSGELETSVQTDKEHIAFLRRAMDFVNSSQFKAGTARLKEFIELCERMEKHKASGTIELICKLTL